MRAVVTDLPTLLTFITRLGLSVTRVDASMVRIAPRDDPRTLPPFYVQWTPNWVVLSILPVIEHGEYRAEDLARRLLAANREMKVAKFAFDSSHTVVLSAELPTESLDASEVKDAIDRMIAYTHAWRKELLGH